MVTRKGLQALAEACADVERATGADAHEVARIVVGALRSAGVVTPHYDGDRFARAVDEARPVRYVVA